MTSFRLDTDVINGYSDAQVWHSRRGKVMKVCYCGLVLCVAGCVAVIVFLLLATGTIPVRQPAAPCDANRDTTVHMSADITDTVTRLSCCFNVLLLVLGGLLTEVLILNEIL